jgi:hypothetical protein
MQQDKRFNDSVEFVSKHYRKGHFSAKEGLRKVGISPLQLWRKRIAVAASVCVVLTASACLYTLLSTSDRQPAPEPTIIQPTQEPQQPDTTPMRDVAQRITFDDAPLSEVIIKIQETYNVTITNIPTEEHRLTLSYEGTADELIETINDLLGTEMKIQE